MDDEVIYPSILKNVGYDTYYFGKWHCGIDKTAEDYGMKGWSLPEYGNLYASERYKDYLKSIGESQPTCRIDHHLFKKSLKAATSL